jgi:hypothetical protein
MVHDARYEEHIDPLRALEDQTSAQAVVASMITNYGPIFEVQCAQSHVAAPF